MQAQLTGFAQAKRHEHAARNRHEVVIVHDAQYAEFSEPIGGVISWADTEIFLRNHGAKRDMTALGEARSACADVLMGHSLLKVSY